MYELAVWIKMFHMTFSHNRGKVVQLVYKPQQSRKFTYNYQYSSIFKILHNRGKVVQLVYKPQQSRKFTYNYLYTISTHSYLINYLKYF